MLNCRLNQTLAEERNSLEAHRRRLLDEISDERERLALTASKQRAEMDTLRNNLEVALTQANEQHKMEIEQLRADLIQRHKVSFYYIRIILLLHGYLFYILDQNSSNKEFSKYR